MNAFKYNISVPANSAQEAAIKMKAISVILSRLNTEELSKIVQVLNNPAQLALIKSHLG